MVAALSREEQISSISNTVKEYKDVSAQLSKLVLYNDNNKWKGSSLTIIDFEPCKEGQLCNIPDSQWETCDELQQLIKVLMEEETRLAALLNSLEHCNTKDGVLFFVEQAIPCILHLENSTLLKALTMLFIEGLSNAQGTCLPSYE